MNKRGHRGSLNNLFIKNFKGQGLSISSIILIILGIIVLVILALGFFIGWQNIVPFVSQDNANTVSSQCLAACTTGSVYDFCSKGTDLTTKSVTLKNVTCNYLAQKQSQYGISTCSAISCSNIVLVTATSTADLQSKCSSNTGKTVQALIDNTLQSAPC
ncbi:MAG: hypothetical protein KGH55_00105 [Nanoarchaeota archaeon]|nr:hypothetical protein [Nanoarchaeota archaeon]